MGLQNPGASHLRIVVIAHRRWRMIERRHQVLPDIAHLRVLEMMNSMITIQSIIGQERQSLFLKQPKRLHLCSLVE